MPGTLRHRPPSSEKAKATPLAVSSDATFTDPSYSRTARYLLSVFLSAVTVSAVLLLYPRSQPAVLSESYAVCSPDGPNIYTVDEHNSRTQCLVVHESFIIDTGTVAQVQQRWNHLHARSFSLFRPHGPVLPIRYTNPGSIIVPGISDSHAHILEYGASRMLPLEGTSTIQDTVARVRNYIMSNPDVYNNSSKFILGGGWDHTSWPVEEWPSAADLESDPIIRGRPVVLQSKDCHALWVSARALESSMPLPESVDGGVIVRDSSGKPTGVLLDNAQDLIRRPGPTEDDLLQRFAVTVRDALSLGLTTIHDAGLDPVSLQFFKEQAEKGNMPIRIYGMTFFNENGEYWGNKTEPVIGAGNGRLSARSVKMFADGALRTGGAALYEPYTDNPSTNGFMRLPTEVIHKVIPQFLRDGWQVNVHGIGDRANSVILDAFEASLEGVNVTALRPRLEHAQLMTKADMVRVGKLGVIASVQPTHAISDMWYAEDRLGPERVKGLYAFRSLIDSGAKIILGSDAPVEDINPLAGFYAAITRVSPDGTSPHGPDGWFPEQRLTREEALRGMTIDPAYASFTESTLGSIVPGKRADFVVLSHDIMKIAPPQILKTTVDATVIDGTVVYGLL